MTYTLSDEELKELIGSTKEALAKKSRPKPDCDVCIDTGYCWGVTSNGNGQSCEAPMHCLDCSDSYELVDEETFDAAYLDAGLNPEDYKP